MTNDQDSGYYCPVMGAWIIKHEAALRQPTQIDALSSFVDIVREAAIEECAKVAEEVGAYHLRASKMSLPVEPSPIIAKDRNRVAEHCAKAIRALKELR
jgi:hypothetical protein